MLGGLNPLCEITQAHTFLKKWVSFDTSRSLLTLVGLWVGKTLPAGLRHGTCLIPRKKNMQRDQCVMREILEMLDEGNVAGSAGCLLRAALAVCCVQRWLSHLSAAPQPPASSRLSCRLV